MNTPKLFISYSWSSIEHEQLILQVATELVESGVEVVLDKWDLKEGHDAYAFMEKMVTDSDIQKVAIFSDKTYAEKADGRSGGVGTETQIISREVYEKQEQDKFVVIVTERDHEGKAYLPTYYKSRIYIDLSEADSYSDNFEKLLRWIYNKPLFIKPEIGKAPSFLDKKDSLSLGATAVFKRAVDAIKGNKPTAEGCLNEYLEKFSENLERFRIIETDGEMDEEIIKNIEQFIPSRNEYIQLLITIAQYKPDISIGERIHRFIEEIIPYMERPSHVTSYNSWSFDNYKFIVHELFIYTLAIFLKYERFQIASIFLQQQYFVESKAENGSDPMVRFDEIRQYIESLERRVERLNLRHYSLRSNLLKERSQGTGITFKYLMQADFTAFIVADLLTKGEYSYWWTETLLHLGHYNRHFEIFARSKSKSYFDKMKVVLGINEVSELAELMEAYRENKQQRIPRWGHNSFNPVMLINYDSLSSEI